MIRISIIFMLCALGLLAGGCRGDIRCQFDIYPDEVHRDLHDATRVCDE